MCVLARSACTPVCVCVWLTVDCLVAQGNSCYWGFLHQHVNKGEPPKSSPVCPPANEHWAPSWAQPVDGEEGRHSDSMRKKQQWSTKLWIWNWNRQQSHNKDSSFLWLSGNFTLLSQTNRLRLFNYTAFTPLRRQILELRFKREMCVRRNVQYMFTCQWGGATWNMLVLRL